MGQPSGFLTVKHLASGIDEMLALLANEGALESLRPPQPPEPNAEAISSVISKVLSGEIRFSLKLLSRPLEEGDSGIWLLWQNEDPAVVQLPFDPELEWEKYWSWLELNRQPKVFDLDVDLALGPGRPMPFLLWSAKPAGQKKSDPVLRRVRSVAAKHAQPRLIFPIKGAALYRDDAIALAAMFAAKAECLRIDNDLSSFFRTYCTSLFHTSFDKLFHRYGNRGNLPMQDWHEVVDRAFDRLYRADKAQGFTMPDQPNSFRAYVRQVLRGEAATDWSRPRSVARGAGTPTSVDEAAARLGISTRTVRRLLNRLNLHEWTEATWEAVRERAQRKASWQVVQRRLEESGRKPDAARKQVQRWRRQGRSPDEALSSLAADNVQLPNCTACGAPAGRDDQGRVLRYEGHPMCAECWLEKTGG
jgi:hypothetical protein